MGHKERVNSGKEKRRAHIEINSKTKGTKDTQERDKQSGNGKEGSTKERGEEKKSAIICPRE